MVWDKITLATDGSCLRNPGGPTGWAWITTDGQSRIGGTPSGTNQIAELHGVLTALRTFPVEDLTIQVDSAYALNVTTKWSSAWKRNKWKTASGTPVQNLSLVRVIHHLMHRRTAPVRFVKVRAHDREGRWPLNEEADRLAKHAAVVARDRRVAFDDEPGI